MDELAKARITARRLKRVEDAIAGRKPLRGLELELEEAGLPPEAAGGLRSSAN